MRPRLTSPRRARLAFRIGLVLAVLSLPLAAAAADTESPHASPDTCDDCHQEDGKSLLSPKDELCTSCHDVTQHAGSAEHLRIEPARVGRALAANPAGEKLPLAEDGRMWCGTCHQWHASSPDEPWLPMEWVPPDRGLPGAVRAGITARWDEIASAHKQKTVEAEFAAKGTRQLWLSYQDGSLCKRCHGDLP